LWALDSKLTALLPLTACFLLQQKDECCFLNGMQQVQFLHRYFYNRQEYVCFNSNLGKHMAVTVLGEADADYCNRNEQKKNKKIILTAKRGFELGKEEARTKDLIKLD
uniref:MHC class II beta chain N-terminal domain-containing protein n=1 Tax=Pseudonaja textilis TaxID=8673 RepID=A0A670ZK97_PSETE